MRDVAGRLGYAGDVFRARLVLALADGHSYSRIERELGTSRRTIAQLSAGLQPAFSGASVTG